MLLFHLLNGFHADDTLKITDHDWKWMRATRRPQYIMGRGGVAQAFMLLSAGRKRYGVAPFYNVLHLLALIDLMQRSEAWLTNRIGGFTGDTGSAQPIYVSNAEAMEA